MRAFGAPDKGLTRDGIMHLRLLVLALVLSSIVAPVAAKGQQPGRAPRIGMLLAGARAADDPRVGAFRQGLRDRGYVDDRSVAIEPRWYDRIPQLPELAIDLVRSRVDLIVTQGTPAAKAAQGASSTTPIVMATSGDPVALGLVSSLARPGGNITGQTILATELSTKRLEILKEIVPGVSRIAVLWNPANPGVVLQMRATEDAARKLGVALQGLSVRNLDELEAAFHAARVGSAGALLVLDDPLFTAHRVRIVGLAAANHLPALTGISGSATAGGLVNYGPNLLDMFRNAAVYVDKILKGAKPADLPIEQPTRFELTINMKTARTLGLVIPPSLLLRADHVIE
jgi:putative tryptophan/tyrosine transport system substrate-binding protein